MYNRAYNNANSHSAGIELPQFEARQSQSRKRFASNEPVQNLPEDIPAQEVQDAVTGINQIKHEQKFQTHNPQNLIPAIWQKRLWAALIILSTIPVLNSTVYNVITLVSAVSTNIKLNSEKKFLEKDKSLLETKLKEYNSRSGLKRAIKEEIDLVEENEIIVRIL